MSSGITRREVLKAALASPIVAAASHLGHGQTESNQFDQIAKARGKVVAIGNAPTSDQVQLVRRWRGPVCSSRVINHGHKSVRVKEVVLFDIPLTQSPATRLYGEGFQMLSQTGGTLGQPVNYSQYTDAQAKTSAADRPRRKIRRRLVVSRCSISLTRK